MESYWFFIVDPWETCVLINPYYTLATLIVYGFRSRLGEEHPLVCSPLFSLIF